MASETRLRASLFDRFVDMAPGGPRVPEHLRRREATELMESVRRDLEFLLSTRCGTSEKVRSDRGRSVLDYGVQDLSHLSSSSQEDRDRAAAAIREAVEACEPRLRRVEIQVDPHPTQFGTFLVLLRARLVAEEHEEQVTFPFVVRR